MWESKLVQQLSERLAESFILCVAIDAKPGQRRIVKYSCLASFDIESQSESHLRAGLGLEPWTMEIPDAILGTSISYHVELSAPPGLDICSAQLIVSDAVIAEDNEERSDAQVAHLHPRGVLPDPPSVGEIVVALTLDAEGFIRQAFLTSGLTTGLLLVGIVLSGMYVAQFLLEVHPAPAAAGAILVAVPGAISLAVAAQEHRLVRRFVNVTRAQTLISAVASFVAAGTLALTSLPQYARLATWVALFVVSLANTTLLANHAFQARRRHL